MDDPRRERGRDARTTTPKTDPDTGAGHRPATAQPRRPEEERDRAEDEAASPPAPNGRERKAR